MKPDWLPNWRNELEYPDLEKTEPLQRAWEFLRRNSEYQRDYERVRMYEQKFPDYDTPENVGAPLSEYAICDPPALENETKDDYIKRMADTPWRIAPLCVALAEKYGLYFPGLSDPSKNAPNNFFYFNEQITPPITHAYYEDWLKHVPSVKPSRISEVVVMFDLELPLLFQIERVKEDLVAKQRSMVEDGLLQPILKRTRETHLVNYLRLLDAEASGISYHEIAKVLFPDKENEYPDYLGAKAVRNGLAAAKRLRA